MAKKAPPTQNQTASEAIDFLPDALAIEQAPPPWRARMTLWTILFGFGAAVAWAGVAEIDRVVVANGKLTTVQSPIVMQPLETSSIRRLDGQVGERVKAGQIVVELDPTFAGADVTASRSEVGSLDAQIARLKSELAGNTTIVEADGISVEQLAVERQLFEDRLSEARAKLDAYQSRERKARAELGELEGLERILNTRRANISEIVKMRETLIEKGGSSRLQMIVAENDRLAVDSELGQLAVRRRGLEEELQTVVAERQAYIKERRRQASEQLVEAQRQRGRIVNTLTKSDARTGLVVLKAPVDAIVFERARLSVGSVAQSAQTLLVLVPIGATLEAEVEIPSKDIALIKGGDRVAVKLEAFPFQRYGTLDGRLKSIAPDANQKPANEGGAITYKAKIELISQRLASVPQGIDLGPGMVVTGEIIAGKRTVLSYFLYPVIRALDEGIREP